MAIRQALLVFLFLGFLFGVSVSLGQTSEARLFVNDPRPVGHAVLELTDRYPVMVTYEDPRYEYDGDLRDITNRVNSNAPDRRVLVPIGGNLEVTFDLLSETNRPADLQVTLNKIMEYHHLSGYAGRFAILRTGDVFHVVPTEVRGDDGRWMPQVSILETAITIEAQEVNGIEALELIADKLEDASGLAIVVGSYGDGNSLYRSTIQLEADAEPAREVLLKTLQSIAKDRFSWLLYYGADVEQYALNIRVVPAQPSSTSSEVANQSDEVLAPSQESFFRAPEDEVPN